ncbi:MAG TPA: TIGR04282 family arsenosugar biosynthesis glycosyltransferase [Roseiflexaceae bacterium]|nr:TIGR04282 family arsenosugar biosynthesis glycosyltransferase [Roseiflexaceae bacterium]
MHRSLLVVAKRPAAGQTKTRLCPPLTGEAAAALYACFLRDTLDLMRQVPDVGRGIVYLPEAALDYFSALAPDMRLSLQEGADLGERLDHLLTAALEAGAAQAVVIDSDSPTLPVDYLVQAFDTLAGPCDVVIGPCEDGGYYLIGLKRPQPRLLRDVQMSTPYVVRDTLALAEELGLRVALLPTWYDVDTVAELDRLRTELPEAPPHVAGYTRAFLTHGDSAA